MAIKNSVKAIPLTNIASSSVSSSYAAINASGLPQACIIIRINNASNKDITVSYDGVNDHEYVLANNFVTFEFQTNSQPNNFIANMAAGTVVWVKGTGGTGNIYLSGYYQPTQ